MPQFILLTGAGFGRNWGGWLADEAFEYLIGCPQVDDDIRTLLWTHKRSGGFEGALARLQSEFSSRRDSVSEQRLTKLENAIRQMSADMNRAFSTVHFDSSRRGVECGVRNYLKMFDAIFTLNQDVLMEQHYFNSGFARDEFSMYRQWAGWQIPGMQPIPAEGEQPHKMTWVPLDSAKFVLEKDRQPYFKLHGASTWSMSVVDVRC